MGSYNSVPESRRSTYTLVYAPFHIEAPELLLTWRKCVEHNHDAATFELVNALSDPPKTSERATHGPPPYVLKDSKIFVQACTPALIQRVYNECRAHR
jgi:hypothetical protein